MNAFLALSGLVFVMADLMVDYFGEDVHEEIAEEKNSKYEVDFSYDEFEVDVQMKLSIRVPKDSDNPEYDIETFLEKIVAGAEHKVHINPGELPVVGYVVDIGFKERAVDQIIVQQQAKAMSF